MRREIAVGVFLLLSAFASHSPAQVEAPPPSDRLADAPAPSPPPPWHPWSGELLLGFPTGVRLQRDLCRDGAWQAEGFVGFDLIFPMVGGGVRHRFTPCRGENDTLSVSPGVDVYLLLNPFEDDGPDSFLRGGVPSVPFVTADVDLVWRHGWGTRFEGEVGCKLGAGEAIGRRESAWLPVFSFFLGCRY